MAPEIVQAFAFDMDIFDYDSDEEDGLELSYDKRCDLWSLGIIAYVLLCGHLPFRASCGRDCGWEDRGEKCHECQHQLFSAIKSGDLEFPEETWSGVSAEAKDLIRQLLIRDASQRIKASAVLNHPWIVAGGDCQPAKAAQSAAAAATTTPPPPSSRPLDTPHVLKRCHRSVHDLLYSELASNALAMKLAREQASAAIQRAVEASPHHPASAMKKSATVINFKPSANVDITSGNQNSRKKLSFCNATSSKPGGNEVRMCPGDKMMRRQASLIVFPEDLATTSLGDLERRWEF